MESDSIQRRRVERAYARRRRQRRRRLTALTALTALAAVVVVVAVLVLTSGGSGRSASAGSGSGAGGGAGHTAAAHRGHGSGSTIGARLGPATGHPGNARVPILMYHVIAAPPAGAPYPGLYVPRAEFAAQMHALARAGWHAVTLDQLRANWLHGNALPRKPIVITFDNGYLSQYLDALPVLRAMRWAAVENIQLTGLPPSQGGMTTAQVAALIHQGGWELDTQGISHADLPALTASELAFQIDHARSVLRARYHVPVNWFCYPSGQYDPTVVAAVRADGFVGSTTVVPGWADRTDSPYALPRLRVLGGTTPAELLAQIAAAQSAGPTPTHYLTSTP